MADLTAEQQRQRDLEQQRVKDAEAQRAKDAEAQRAKDAEAQRKANANGNDAQTKERERALAAGNAQADNKTEDEKADPAEPTFRAYDPYLDIDSNCNMGTAHGMPVGPMTQGCGLQGRMPYGNKENMAPVRTGDVRAANTEPTVERDVNNRVGLAAAGEQTPYQRAQIERSKEQADKVAKESRKPVKTEEKQGQQVAVK